MHHQSLPSDRRAASTFRSTVQPSAPPEERNFIRWKYLLLGVTGLAAVVLMATLISVHFSYKGHNKHKHATSTAKPIEASSTPRDLTTAGSSKTTDGSSPQPKEGTTEPDESSDELTTENDNFNILPFDPPDQPTNQKPPANLKPPAQAKEYAFTELATNIKRTVHPCDDFYEYACGSFREKYPLLKNKTEVNYYTLHSDKVYQKIVKRLESDELKSEESDELMTYVKDIWDSCVAEDKSSTNVQLEKVTEYLSKLDEINSWQEKFAKLTRDGFNVLFTVKVNKLNSTIHIGKPKFEFDEAYSISRTSPLMTYYLGLISLYSGSVNIRRAREIIEFEHLLSTSFTPATEIYPHPLILNEVNSRTDIEWHKYLSSFFSPKKFKLLDRIRVDDVQYLDNFEKAIKGKDLSFWNEYFKVKVMQQSCFFLGKKCRPILLKLNRAIDGDLNEEEFVKRICFNTLNEHMEDLMFKVYDSQPKQEDPLAYYKEMTSKLVTEFKFTINEMSWMDAATKVKAKSSLDKVLALQEVRMPNYLSDKSLLEEKYLEAPFITEPESDPDLFDYFFNLIKFKRGKEWSIQGHKSKATWPISLFATHPFIRQETKDLFVPDFFVDGPFALHSLPDAVKFGSLGALLAHEITHAFDAVAANYEEAQGGQEFWSKKTFQSFKDKMKCLVDVYDRINVEVNGEPLDVHLNGSSLLNENLADWIGLTMAYEAFVSLEKSTVHFDRKNSHPDLKEMTDEQMFFLAFANVHCATDSIPKSDREIRETPRKFRVDVSLAFTPKFAEVFECEMGSRVNPGTNTPKCTFE